MRWLVIVVIVLTATSAAAQTATVTVNGTTGALTVAPGTAMTVAVTNAGTANVWDYVMVAPTGAPADYWTGVFQFLNGTATLPATPITTATLAVIAPTALGAYEVRFNAAGQFARLATSGVITVGTTPPSPPPPPPTTPGPWIVYGQTMPVCNGDINNPTPNVNGLVGEVAALPYTVPDGTELIIDAYGIESYATATGGVVLAPYIGPTPPIPNNAFLHSVYSNDQSNETTGVEFHIPAGKVFNIRLMSSECPSSVTGWYVKGHLIDAQ